MVTNFEQKLVLPLAMALTIALFRTTIENNKKQQIRRVFSIRAIHSLHNAL
jgi:hypothetical protein